MLYYDHHVFICINSKEPNKVCCAASGSQALFNCAKAKIRALTSSKKIRVSYSGCLGRCNEGPILVVYPEAVWYRCQAEQDLNEIIDQHLLQGRVVDRLLLSSNTK